MKNISILFSVLAISLLIISCNSEESIQNKPSNETTESYELLAQELAAYNAAFYEEHNIPQTKGKFWRKIKSIVKADAKGALEGFKTGSIKGAIVGAVASSIIEACSSTSTRSTSYNFTPINLHQTVTQQGVGYLHNTIISDIAEENISIYSQPISQERLFELLSAKAVKYNISLSDEEIKDLINQAAATTPQIEFESSEAETQYYKEQLPEYTFELDLIESFVSGIEPINDNFQLVTDYYQGYTETLSSSQFIPIQHKETALLAIDVAANSAVLWSIQE